MPTKVGTPICLHLRAAFRSAYTPQMLSALGWIALIQAVYFLFTGLWPILHIRSFMKVTGPKQDLWLVRTVGVLVTVIGMSLAVAVWRDQGNAAMLTLAMGS